MQNNKSIHLQTYYTKIHTRCLDEVYLITVIQTEKNEQ